MKKITLSFEVLTAIIAVTILQTCAGTAAAAPQQCVMPTLSTPTPAGPHAVWVTVTTTTQGAYLHFTINNSQAGVTINKASYPVKIYIPRHGTTKLSAKAIRSGWIDSSPAVETYH